MAEPSQTALHHPAQRAQSATVVRADPCQKRKYATRATGGDVFRRAVSAVTQSHVRLLTWTPTLSGDSRHPIEQRDRRLGIMHVGRCGDDNQGNTEGIRQDMAFAAFFRAVRGVGAGVAPPKSARTLALSMTPKEASIRPWRPRASSSFSWMRGHTPAVIHSCKRRQQVTPDPQPSSAGTKRQGMPVRSTYVIPVRHARSGTRGRPPLGFGGSRGKRGSTSRHKRSETSVNAMVSPPCYPWHSFHRQTHEF
jgi:hypothetical protein